MTTQPHYEISLIGAKTYGTLKTVYQEGQPAIVTAAVWELLKEEVNPATGATLFCLTSDLPPPASKGSPDISSADLRSVGLGELDTGMQSVASVEHVENTLDILKESDEELPSGAPDDSNPGEVLLQDALQGAEDQSGTSDTPTDPEAAKTPDTAPQTASKKITLGKGKAVTV